MGTHYGAARRSDPDFAEWLMEQPAVEQVKWRPQLQEWGLQEELLAYLGDRMGDWMAQYANSHRRKGSAPVRPPSRFPRPQSAIDRAQALVEARRHGEVLDLVKAAQERYRRDKQQNGG